MTENQALVGRLLAAAMHNQKFSGSICDVNWAQIFQIAQEHLVDTLLYWVVKDIPQEAGGPAPALLKAWQEVALVQTVNQVLYRAQIMEIMAMLEKGHIPAILIKGPVLQDLYPRPEYRSMSDVDILIRNGDIERAVTALQELGYKKDDSDSKHVSLCHDRRLTVELHTKLSDDYFTEKVLEWEKVIWTRAVPTTVCGITVNTLSDTDHLLYLCLHMANHFILAGFGIRQLCDLVVFVEKKRDSVDWALFYSHLKAMGMDAFADSLFKACDVLFGLGDPLFNRECEADVVDRLIRDVFAGGIYGKGTMARFISSKYLSFLRPELAEDQQAGRLKRLCYLIFPPYRIIRKKYTYIENRPYLTPVAWVHRIAVTLFSKGKVLRLGNYRAFLQSQKIFEERYGLLQRLKLM